MKRTEVFETAHHAITKDRAATHGRAEDSFGLIARLWSADLGLAIQAHDVARLMVLFKCARMKGNPTHEDSAVDAAGYAALACELAAEGKA